MISIQSKIALISFIFSSFLIHYPVYSGETSTDLRNRLKNTHAVTSEKNASQPIIQQVDSDVMPVTSTTLTGNTKSSDSFISNTYAILSGITATIGACGCGITSQSCRQCQYLRTYVYFPSSVFLIGSGYFGWLSIEAKTNENSETPKK